MNFHSPYFNVGKRHRFLNDLIDEHNIFHVYVTTSYDNSFCFKCEKDVAYIHCAKDQIHGLFDVFDKQIKSISTPTCYVDSLKIPDGVQELIFHNNNIKELQTPIPETVKSIYMSCGANWVDTIKSNLNIILTLPLSTNIVMVGPSAPQKKEKYKSIIYNTFGDTFGKLRCERFSFAREHSYDIPYGVSINFVKD